MGERRQVSVDDADLLEPVRTASGAHSTAGTSPDDLPRKPTLANITTTPPSSHK